MTDIIRKNIKGKCPKCGIEGGIDLYQSVNVTVDPGLLTKIKNREINSFHCGKCGHKNEIIMPFLYNNMAKKLMVWVYPKGYEGPEINDSSQDTKMAKIIKEFMAKKLLLKVYGFDELFKLLEEHEK